MLGELWIWDDVEIEGISDNSQMIKQGYIFICVKNDADGLAYSEEAVEKGAVAVVSECRPELKVPVIQVEDIRFTEAILAKRFYFPGEKCFKLIGVTGTNGKTTVTHLIRDILEACGKSVGMIGTNGIFIKGERKDLYTNTPTTPNSLELWQIFGAMKGVEYIVMEVSSHALSLKRVMGCEFDVGVFTNLTADHLDFHVTMEEYKKAKEKLFLLSKISVINIDDPTGAEIYSNVKTEKLSVGFNDSDFSVRALSMKDYGSRFGMEYRENVEWIEFHLPGRFNVYNALSAVGACVAAGIDFKDAVSGLSLSEPIKGRMERLPIDCDFSVIIDYAHSPDGLEKLIHTAKGFARGRVITLFGCGGDRDKTKRAVMGEISGRLSDYTIITSDNPRTESPFLIIGDIYEGIKKTKGEYCIVPEREMAIYHALSMAGTGDVILLAGKGHEDYQIIGKEKVHFDEREIVSKFFCNRG